MLVRLFFIAFLVFISAEALANSTPKPLNKSWQTKWFPRAHNNDTAPVVWITDGFELSGDFKTWYLLGEPVINCTARWTNSAKASVTVPSSSQNLIETAQEGEVELYNLMLAYIAPDPRYSGGNENQIVLFCDAGIVAQNGRKGFNVAGSPSWDKFICTVEPGYKDIRIRFKDDDLCKSIGGNWLNSANAKSVAISGLDSRKTGLWNGETKVLKGEVNGMSVIKRVEKRLWREKSARFKQQRTRAYFDNYPRRPGETTANWSSRKSESMRHLPNLPLINPTTNQLKSYEFAWRDIIKKHISLESYEKLWRAKEHSLIENQLIIVKSINKMTAQEEQKLGDYLDALHKQRNELIHSGLYGALGVKPSVDQSTNLWGYSFPDGEWHITPQFYKAYNFSQDGTAEVILKDQFLRSETRQHTYSVCGISKTKTVHLRFRLREVSAINFKGQFIKEPVSEEYIENEHDIPMSHNFCLSTG